jgi:hypothetical protein
LYYKLIRIFYKIFILNVEVTFFVSCYHTTCSKSYLLPNRRDRHNDSAIDCYCGAIRFESRSRGWFSWTKFPTVFPRLAGKFRRKKSIGPWWLPSNRFRFLFTGHLIICYVKMLRGTQSKEQTLLQSEDSLEPAGAGYVWLKEQIRVIITHHLWWLDQREMYFLREENSKPYDSKILCITQGKL